MRIYTGVKSTIDPEMFKKRAGAAARAVAAQAERDSRPYIPSSRIEASAVVLGRKVIWSGPFVQEFWGGKLQVDPEYHVGGFPRGDGSFYSRRGVEKVSSGRTIRFRKGTRMWALEARRQNVGAWKKIAAEVLLHG